MHINSIANWCQKSSSVANRCLAMLVPCSVLLLAACASDSSHAPLPTVAQVDVNRYMGRWYEVAMLPNRFQSQCASDTQANYALQGDKVQVINRCRQTDGKLVQAQGVAKIVPDSGNAKLRVSFFRPFYGNYWVLALDDNYQYALVGEPSRDYAWVLSRTPKLDDATLQVLLSRAQTLGFDKNAFVQTPHTQAIE